MNKRGAFTYVELMIVVLVMAILTLGVVANGGTAGREHGRLAGERFAADVAYARSLSIARPDDPVVIKVDVSGNSYWLARSATPDTPITHPSTKKPYLVSFGGAGNSGLTSAQLLACDFGDDAVLAFDGMGDTDQQTAALFQVTSAGQEYEVSVQSAGSRTTVTKGITKQLVADPELVDFTPIPAGN